MTASLEEVRQEAQRLLDMMGLRIRSGKVIINIGDFQVQGVDAELHGLHRRLPRKREEGD